jgi:hypothetical protein
MINKQIANIFNSYFSSIADEIIATNTNERNIKSNSGDQAGNIFQNTRCHYPRNEFRYTSTQEIDKIIKSLKVKDSHAYDEISVEILKWSSPYIVFPLTYICNKSLEMGTFPSRLKFPVVNPIYKAGDKQNSKV